MTSINPESLSVLLVDDHAVVREGYRRLLEYHGGFRIVAEAGDADAAYAAWRRHRPEITILDLMLPGVSGIEAIRRIVAFEDGARILVLSMVAQPALARQAIEAGALGYLTKDCPPEELLAAVEEVSNGRRYLCRPVAQELALMNLDPAARSFAALSPREFEVCQLLLSGMRVEEIGARLNISPKTVSNVLSLARQKLGVGSDLALAQLAARAGLIDWSG